MKRKKINTGWAFLSLLILFFSCQKEVIQSSIDQSSESIEKLQRNLQPAAMMLTEIVQDAAIVQEVKSTIDKKTEYGDDEFINLIPIPAEDGNIYFPNPLLSAKLKSLLADENTAKYSSVFSKKKASDINEFILTHPLEIYWPNSQDWDGVETPTICYALFADAPKINNGKIMTGYRKTGNSYVRIAVDENYIGRHPVWILQELQPTFIAEKNLMSTKNVPLTEAVNYVTLRNFKFNNTGNALHQWWAENTAHYRYSRMYFAGSGPYQITNVGGVQRIVPSGTASTFTVRASIPWASGIPSPFYDWKTFNGVTVSTAMAPTTNRNFWLGNKAAQERVVMVYVTGAHLRDATIRNNFVYNYLITNQKPPLKWGAPSPANTVFVIEGVNYDSRTSSGNQFVSYMGSRGYDNWLYALVYSVRSDLQHEQIYFNRTFSYSQIDGWTNGISGIIGDNLYSVKYQKN